MPAASVFGYSRSDIIGRSRTEGDYTLAPMAEWHWEQGNKYALEGMKVLLLLNGGAAVALMTFLGHLANDDRKAAMATAGWSLVWFGLGALLATVVFITAYLAQLEYGKEALSGKPQPWAWRWHLSTYVVIGGSVIAFLAGLGCAWSAIGRI